MKTEPMFGYNPETDIPDLSGKVIVVTGGTSGLGKGSTMELAKHNPAHIFLPARSQSKANDTINEVKKTVPDARITFVEMDMKSLASVQKAANQILAQTERIDVLMAVAGIMNVPPELTQDSYELQFGVNHMAHALLIQHFLPLLSKAEGRIVSLTSLGAGFSLSGGIQFKDVHTDQAKMAPLLAGYFRYGQSKLANILYARALAKHHPEITSLAVHPGLVKTELNMNRGYVDKQFIKISSWMTGTVMIAPEEGIKNQLWAATVKKEDMTNGSWYEPVGQPGRKINYATDDELAEKLYAWTAEELAPWMN